MLSSCDNHSVQIFVCVQASGKYCPLVFSTVSFVALLVFLSSLCCQGCLQAPKCWQPGCCPSDWDRICTTLHWTGPSVTSVPHTSYSQNPDTPCWFSRECSGLLEPAMPSPDSCVFYLLLLQSSPPFSSDPLLPSRVNSSFIGSTAYSRPAGASFILNVPDYAYQLATCLLSTGRVRMSPRDWDLSSPCSPKLVALGRHGSTIPN